MAVTLHTSLGDIKLELYCDLVPRTCEVSQWRMCGCGCVPWDNAAAGSRRRLRKKQAASTPVVCDF
jgi:hypothetical protein